jgi:hypothetical protein
MSTKFKPELLSAISVGSIGDESARKASEARLKLLETSLSANLVESFASGIRDLWNLGETTNTIDQVALAAHFPHWKLEAEGYNLLLAWGCSLVQVTDIRREVSEFFRLSGDESQSKETLDSIDALSVWIFNLAKEAKWNLTLFRIPSFASSIAPCTTSHIIEFGGNICDFRRHKAILSFASNSCQRCFFARGVSVDVLAE